MMDSSRIDKWLWAARFFRSRSLAQQAIERGRVLVGGERVKTARALKVGDGLTIRIGDDECTIVVLELDTRRGPAIVAQALYRETDESIARRQARRDARRWSAEPAHSIVQGRPTKRNRRQLSRFGEQQE
jgi:ribosome-associated heat shock protein Hsp15